MLEETLDLASTFDDELVFFRKLVHAENSDDVLELLLALKDSLHVACTLLVFFTNDQRIEDSGRRVNGVYRGVVAKLGDLA